MFNSQIDFNKTRKGLTLNSLKEQRYSLTMRLLLAMSWGDMEMQEELKKEIQEIERQIECMNISKR